MLKYIYIEINLMANLTNKTIKKGEYLMENGPLRTPIIIKGKINYDLVYETHRNFGQYIPPSNQSGFVVTGYIELYGENFYITYYLYENKITRAQRPSFDWIANEIKNNFNSSNKNGFCCNAFSCGALHAHNSGTGVKLETIYVSNKEDHATLFASMYDFSKRCVTSSKPFYVEDLSYETIWPSFGSILKAINIQKKPFK